MLNQMKPIWLPKGIIGVIYYGHQGQKDVSAESIAKFVMKSQIIHLLEFAASHLICIQKKHNGQNPEDVFLV